MATTAGGGDFFVTTYDGPPHSSVPESLGTCSVRTASTQASCAALATPGTWSATPPTRGDMDNVRVVYLDGSVGIITIPKSYTDANPILAGESLEVHLKNNPSTEFIRTTSSVVTMLADPGAGGWPIVTSAKVDSTDGGAVFTVKNMDHSDYGGSGNSATSDGTNNIKIAFAVFTASEDQAATNVNNCAGNPCQNLATCVGDLSSNHKFAYSCACRSGYSGANCEICDTAWDAIPARDVVFIGRNTFDIATGATYGEPTENWKVGQTVVVSDKGGGNCAAAAAGPYKVALICGRSDVSKCVNIVSPGTVPIRVVLTTSSPSVGSAYSLASGNLYTATGSGEATTTSTGVNDACQVARTAAVGSCS